MTTRSSMLRSDSELVRAVLRGMHERYSELVRRYKSLVTTYCYSRVAQRETSEDLAQETFGARVPVAVAFEEPFGVLRLAAVYRS